MGERRTKQGERIGEIYQVYKHWYDADGNEVNVEPYEKVTYKYYPAIINIGVKPPEPTPLPEEQSHEPAPIPVEEPPMPSEGLPVEDPTSETMPDQAVDGAV